MAAYSLVNMDGAAAPQSASIALREREDPPMRTPLQITFRHADRSGAVESRVRELVAKLERVHDRITDCRVTIEGPPAHHNKGGAYTVRIALAIPGGEINANSDHSLSAAHADVYVALRDAFDGARRQLVSFGSQHAWSRSPS
jgi:ribosome-associated translation inhibitor RaiA